MPWPTNLASVIPLTLPAKPITAPRVTGARVQAARAASTLYADAVHAAGSAG